MREYLPRLYMFTRGHYTKIEHKNQPKMSNSKKSSISLRLLKGFLEKRNLRDLLRFESRDMTKF